MTYHPRGRYFEEFSLGERVTTAGRTVTEADIISFAGLSGDFTQVHTNVEYARQTMYGQRIAHGLLVASIASGLLVRLGFLEETVLAFREMTWKFNLPVFIGDTVHVEGEVTGLKATRRLAGGAVTIDLQVINQGGKMVQSGTWLVLVSAKPALE